MDSPSPNSTEADYDALPYRSVPYPVTQPAKIGALAKFFGLDPVDPARARILELGCASGGNLLPLALRYPEATCRGIDLGRRHVDDAAAMIAALDIKNARVDYGDIAEASYGPDAFDYIICHGVFSWVPEAAQDAILRIAAESLSPDGVLYVSYNIYPGWHMRKIVRDLCLYHAGTDGTPEHRVARARWALKEIAENSRDRTPYGELLRKEAAQNAKMPDSYILGEFLAVHNAPCYFHEFLSRATAAGLTYLSEADLAASLPEALPQESAKLIRSIAGDSGLAIEQYMDFFGGRQFRRSLLTRADQAGRISRTIGPERLAGMHLRSGWREDAKEKTGKGVVFRREAESLDVTEPALLAILRALEAAAPGTATPGMVFRRMVAEGLVSAGADQSAFLRGLLALLIADKIEVFLTAQEVGRADQDRPEVFALARHQAAAGQTWVANLQHRPVSVAAGTANILALFDGTRDREALAEALIDAMLAGTLPVNGQTLDPATPRARLAPVGAQVLTQVLATLERQALLAPQP